MPFGGSESLIDDRKFNILNVNLLFLDNLFTFFHRNYFLNSTITLQKMEEFFQTDPQCKPDIHILLIFYYNFESLKFTPVLNLMAWNMLCLTP